MINTFDGFIRRLDKVKERLSELEDMSVITPPKKCKGKKDE